MSLTEGITQLRHDHNKRIVKLEQQVKDLSHTVGGVDSCGAAHQEALAKLQEQLELVQRYVQNIRTVIVQQQPRTAESEHEDGKTFIGPVVPDPQDDETIGDLAHGVGEEPKINKTDAEGGWEQAWEVISKDTDFATYGIDNEWVKGMV